MLERRVLRMAAIQKGRVPFWLFWLAIRKTPPLSANGLYLINTCLSVSDKTRQMEGVQWSSGVGVLQVNKGRGRRRTWVEVRVDKYEKREISNEKYWARDSRREYMSQVRNRSRKIDAYTSFLPLYINVSISHCLFPPLLADVFPSFWFSYHNFSFSFFAF